MLLFVFLRNITSAFHKVNKLFRNMTQALQQCGYEWQGMYMGEYEQVSRKVYTSNGLKLHSWTTAESWWSDRIYGGKEKDALAIPKEQKQWKQKSTCLVRDEEASPNREQESKSEEAASKRNISSIWRSSSSFRSSWYWCTAPFGTSISCVGLDVQRQGPLYTSCNWCYVE